MEGIRFNNLKKKQKIILIIFTATILIFLKLMEVQNESIWMQKDSVQSLIDRSVIWRC